MNGIYTRLVCFLSEKLNIAPVFVQAVLVVLCCVVSGGGVDEFTIILTAIFVPFITIASYFTMGKSWFKKPGH
jgi:bacteriorhodopsin